MTQKDPPFRTDALRDEDPIQLGRESAPGGGAPGRDAAGVSAGDTFPAFWQAVIGDGETVLWFGRPDLTLAARNAPQGGGRVIVLYLIGAVIGLGLLLQNYATVLRIAGLVIAFLCGLQILRRQPNDVKRLGATRYLLTDKAVYVGRLRAGEALAASRTALTPRQTVTGGDTSVRIELNTPEPRVDHVQHLKLGDHVTLRDIPDASHVLDLIRSVRKGMQ